MANFMLYVLNHNKNKIKKTCGLSAKHTIISKHILTYPLSFLKQLTAIQADVFTHKGFLLRNCTVSVNLSHENLKENLQC